MGIVGLLATIAFIVGIVFLIFKKVRKIGFWMAPLGLILALSGFYVAGSSNTSDTITSSGSSKTAASTASSKDTSTNNNSGSDKTSSSNANTSTSIEKTTNVNFVDTIGMQTTKVESAEIRNVYDASMRDDNGHEVLYALLIKMSVTNNAQDSASTYPSQGHLVLPDGTQINGIVSADSQYTDAFKDGEIANGATVSGYVIFPLTLAQATDFKSGNFKFKVICGDDNLTNKNYDVNIKFQ